MAPPVDIDDQSNAELRALVLQLLDRVAGQGRLIVELRDEIARLKGLKGRPNIKPNKPSGMEQATSHKPKGSAGRSGRGKKPSLRVAIEDRALAADMPADAPPGARFKGYQDYIVQDLVISPQVIRYRRERWVTADGRTVTAPLPAGVNGHFGPELRRFVLMQYHQGQVTVPRLVEQLRCIGLAISKRQILRLLNEGHDAFLTEARDVLRSGLATAAWLTVDDTGARHKARNGYCTHIGNDRFASFATTGSKSRHNFLGLLRGGHGDYVINDEAFAYMRERGLSARVIRKLVEHPDRRFADHEAWHAHLERLGIADLSVSPNPLLIASEGALWGSIRAHGFLDNAVIVSDGAGQFEVGRHASCWVHTERLIHQLDSSNARDREEQQHIRALTWNFYRDLKAYRDHPCPTRRASLRARFDRIFKRKTKSVMLARLLKRIHANRDDLLVVLDRPEIPLHTNGSENDIRCYVTRRKISAGTRSDDGRDARDAFLGIAKTCAKLGITFWDYLGDRLNITGALTVPPLPALVSA
jgi:hypothetical protein